MLIFAPKINTNFLIEQENFQKKHIPICLSMVCDCCFVFIGKYGRGLCKYREKSQNEAQRKNNLCSHDLLILNENNFYNIFDFYKETKSKYYIDVQKYEMFRCACIFYLHLPTKNNNFTLSVLSPYTAHRQVQEKPTPLPANTSCCCCVMPTTTGVFSP